MEEDKKKLGNQIDRLVMGVILGGAIGSVLGLTLAPRKGKETREMIKQKGQELIEKGKTVSGQFARDHRETIESAKYQFKKGKKGFLKWLFRKKEKTEPMPKMTIDEERPQ